MRGEDLDQETKRLKIHIEKQKGKIHEKFFLWTSNTHCKSRMSKQQTADNSLTWEANWESRMGIIACKCFGVFCFGKLEKQFDVRERLW